MSFYLILDARKEKKRKESLNEKGQGNGKIEGRDVRMEHSIYSETEAETTG
jgi:hypothetical protein